METLDQMRTKLSDVLAMLAHMSAIYATDKVGESTAQAWLPLVADLDPDDMQRAAIDHAKISRWFPTPSDIIARVVHSNSSAEIAWVNVRRQIKSVGYYGIPTFDEPTSLAVEGVGWEALCSCDVTDISFLHAQFLKSYASMVRGSDLLIDSTTHLQFLT